MLTPLHRTLAWWHTKQAEADSEDGWTTAEVLTFAAVTIAVIVTLGVALNDVAQQLIQQLRSAVGG